MYRSVLVLTFSVILSFNLYAQPDPLWIRTYDGGDQGTDAFCDIYACTDGGFGLCGGTNLHQEQQRAWIVRTNFSGEVEWSVQWGEPRGYNRLWSLIETDDGGFVSAGFCDGEGAGMDIRVIRVTEEGEVVWSNRYGGDNDDKAFAVIELKSDDFLVAGRTRSFGAGNSDGYLIKLDGDGEVLWARTYGGQEFEEIRALREMNNGALLAGNQVRNNQRDLWLVHVDEDGDERWTRNIGSPDERESLSGMATCTQGGGYVLCGNVGEAYGYRDYLLVNVDAEGRQRWSCQYEINTEDSVFSTCQNVNALPENGGYVLVGNIGGRSIQSVIVRTDGAGNEQWQRLDMFGDINPDSLPTHFRSVVIADNNSIVATGSVGNDNGNSDGLVVRLIPERSAPIIISHIPEDLELIILQYDTIAFSVNAIDLQEDSIRYIWTLEDSIVSTATSVNIYFEDLGSFSVTCVVSDGEQEASVQWDVNVVEFYIVDFRPDSTEMTIRRRSSVDFAIDVRANDFEGLGYYWDLIDRNGMRQEIGNGDSVRIQFDLSGYYDVEGVVWRGDNFDMARWAVTVRSAVWGWWPDTLAWTVPFDTTMDFEVIPFNPASDSLGYFWTLNNDPLDVDTTVSMVSIEFPFINQEIIRCIVCDGCEADTVTWLIDVIDPHDVALDPDDLLPESVSLSTPFPNPFNAVTRIAYTVPTPGHVKLAIYDISGRMVGMLVDEDVSAGRYVCEFDGGDLAAGLYFVRLEVFETRIASYPGHTRVIMTRKAVVVK